MLSCQQRPLPTRQTTFYMKYYLVSVRGYKNGSVLLQEDLVLLLPGPEIQELQHLASFQLSLGPVMKLTALDGQGFLDLKILLLMPRLTFLNLSGNCMPCLPPAVSNLQCLQILHVEDNICLQLSKECLKTLESLLQLRKIVIDRDVWSALRSKKDVDMLGASGNRMSANLEIELFDREIAVEDPALVAYLLAQSAL